MRQSQLFYKTKKELPKEAKTISHKLLTRADFIAQLASGIYSFLPLGWRVHRKIKKIIREEMEEISGQEVFLPTLQPKELWQRTNRWQNMQPPLFKLKDRHKAEFALGPTAEEVITEIAKSRIQSYKDLPLYLYQFQNKFRNEMRSTGGLLRTREFIMKDLYSFHSSEKDLRNFFDKVVKVYSRIFRRCGLRAEISEASGGTFTEFETYEFQVPAEVGEDKVIFCPKCNFAVNLEVAKVKKGNPCPECKTKLEKINTIEIGHTFNLGTKYAKALGLYFVDKDGKKQLVKMGCYGIGLGRLIGTIVEIHHDEKGIIWSKEVAPFSLHLIQIENTKKVRKIAERLYKNLRKSNFEVLYDDRKNVTPGEKLVEADLIGIPQRLVVSEKTLSKNRVEIKKRSEKKARLIKISQLMKIIC
ncbi:proline--tRNA ligase [Patescibacteria group bacterium]|nr:proline--tRNA ligase [Patescibacteria group bacterium]